MELLSLPISFEMMKSSCGDFPVLFVVFEREDSEIGERNDEEELDDVWDSSSGEVEIDEVGAEVDSNSDSKSKGRASEIKLNKTVNILL